MKTKILVTGAAGFIGYHVCERLLQLGHEVAGIDDLNDYYDTDLKQARLGRLVSQPGFSFHKLDLADENSTAGLFAQIAPDMVLHLAAQAGVRYSITHPFAYALSNLTGFLSVLEACRRIQVAHLVYASSSSVYGANTEQPYSEHHSTRHPVSLYAATKLSNEMMAHSYSHLFGLPTTGLRFFTVYGPWGRPDMAYFSFTKAILEGNPIEIFNNGEMSRDFTYIDDVVEGVVRILAQPAQPNPGWNSAQPDPASSKAPYRLYNIGNNKPVSLLRFVEAIETSTGKKAIKIMREMQPGDVVSTAANVDDLSKAVAFAPNTTIEVGIQRFVEWYKAYYGAGLQ
jgi:UDP-glucuronate 4-epimerase